METGKQVNSTTVNGLIGPLMHITVDIGATNYASMGTWVVTSSMHSTGDDRPICQSAEMTRKPYEGCGNNVAHIGQALGAYGDTQINSNNTCLVMSGYDYEAHWRVGNQTTFKTKRLASGNALQLGQKPQVVTSTHSLEVNYEYIGFIDRVNRVQSQMDTIDQKGTVQNSPQNSPILHPPQALIVHPA